MTVIDCKRFRCKPNKRKENRKRALPVFIEKRNGGSTNRNIAGLRRLDVPGSDGEKSVSRQVAYLERKCQPLVPVPRRLLNVLVARLDRHAQQLVVGIHLSCDVQVIVLKYARVAQNRILNELSVVRLQTFSLQTATIGIIAHICLI